MIDAFVRWVLPKSTEIKASAARVLAQSAAMDKSCAETIAMARQADRLFEGQLQEYQNVFSEFLARNASK